MVETRQCSFCGSEIEYGTGKMYVKVDGQVFYFCSGKCKKNMVKLGRKDRETRWTKKYAQEKALKTYHKKKKSEKTSKDKKTTKKKLKKKRIKKKE